MVLQLLESRPTPDGLFWVPRPSQVKGKALQLKGKPGTPTWLLARWLVASMDRNRNTMVRNELRWGEEVADCAWARADGARLTG